MRGPGTRMPPSQTFPIRHAALRARHTTQDTEDTVGAAHRSAARAWGARPVPFRTRKLSPIAPRVLRGQPVGGQGAADRWTAPSRSIELRRGRPRGLPLFCVKGQIGALDRFPSVVRNVVYGRDDQPCLWKLQTAFNCFYLLSGVAGAPHLFR